MERRDGRWSRRRRKILTRREKNRKRRKIRRIFNITAFNFWTRGSKKMMKRKKR